MGDAGDNRLTGASGRDSIYGLGGSDLLFGRNGGDYLNGGTGHDGLYGGNGDDVLFGNAGNDLLHGGKGDDRLDGGTGIDTANYSDETIGLFADLFTGDVVTRSGVDRLTSIERFYGGAGDDVVTADGDGDSAGGNVPSGQGFAIFGFGGSDAITGGAGNDHVYGGAGDDHLSGGRGDDRLHGGSGDDVLSGGAGTDRLDGGSGFDTADYSSDTSGLIVELIVGRVSTSTGNEHLTSIERFYGGSGGDVMTGVALSQPTGEDAGAARGWDIFGLGGRDFISGGNGDDTIHGGADDDGLSGHDGDDHVLGEAGDDILFGGAGDDLLVGGADKDEFDALINIAEDPSELSFVMGRSTVLDFTRGTDKINASFFSGDRTDELGNGEIFTRLDSNHDGKLTSADRWIDKDVIDPEGMGARGSLVIDLGNAVAKDLVGSGHTMTLYDVTSLTRSDFMG